MSRNRKLTLFGLVSLVLLASLACIASGIPTAKTLPAEELDRLPAVVSVYSMGHNVPPQWWVGVVWQERYDKSYGMNSDAYNNVRVRVFVPNGFLVIIPCNPKQEMHFARDYDPGDVVAFKMPSSEDRLNEKQDELHICWENIMMVEKGGVWMGAGE